MYSAFPLYVHDHHATAYAAKQHRRPWSANLSESFHNLLGSDKPGVTAVALLSNSLAPSTYAIYDSALRIFHFSVHMKTSSRYRPPRPQWCVTLRG